MPMSTPTRWSDECAHVIWRLAKRSGDAFTTDEVMTIMAESQYKTT